MYLLDTDILSNLVKKRPSPYLIERLRDIPQDKQYISSIPIDGLVKSLNNMSFRAKREILPM